MPVWTTGDSVGQKKEQIIHGSFFDGLGYDRAG